MIKKGKMRHHVACQWSSYSDIIGPTPVRRAVELLLSLSPVVSVAEVDVAQRN